jgi:hypothetical protein
MTNIQHNETNYFHFIFSILVEPGIFPGTGANKFPSGHFRSNRGKSYKMFDNYDTSIKIRDSQKYYNENAIKNQIRLSKADRAKVRQISYEMGDICNITSKLPKYHRDYYIKKVIEIGVHSLGKVPLDTTLAQLIALENHIKLSVTKNTDITHTEK